MCTTFGFSNGEKTTAFFFHTIFGGFKFGFGLHIVKFEFLHFLLLDKELWGMIPF